MNRIYESMLEGIGGTPLIRLSSYSEESGCGIFAKLEFANPMGSIKDRIAKHMVEAAERDGRIKPGATIVDNSSGNTALGLAMVCALKGYKLKIVIRDTLSPEKIKFLKALGVELVYADTSLPPESPRSYNNLAPQVAAETPGGFYLDQHNNRENNAAHTLTTGPEIWRQMEGRIDVFIAGIGTGGTISGVARFLKEKDPRIKVVGIDPAGSIFYDYFHSKTLVRPSPYLMEGLGDEFLIGCVEFDLIDDILRIDDRTAFRMTKELARREAIFAGGSSGAALWGALEVAKRTGPGARIATIFADSANRYLSTIYSDAWLTEKGMI
ncbi:MAG: cysteine synthase family protein [Candidatus Aminicenantes bacterium]|nr:cysteine synthase family protein [Candidatus Aminicenantes bacterium]